MVRPRHRRWEIAEREATDERVYLDRRTFLRDAGMVGLGLGLAGCNGSDGAEAPDSAMRGADAVAEALRLHPDAYPAPRNPAYTLDRPLTDRTVAAAYTNFYEFRNDKDRIAELAAGLTLRPWTVTLDGLVEQPRTVDVDELLRRLPVEERLYRHRCVEAWAMAVPWTGMPLRSLVELARPLSSARYLRMVSFMRPAEAIGQRVDTWYDWPYHEGLSLAEATNELAFVATGIYAKPLPPQHGAPLRLVVPWKYGYKSIKSIVRFEFVAERPPTFWNEQAPNEYGFVSNVDPAVPHPRWSQATERMLGTGERRPTLPYNGYAEWVADLYA